MASRANEEPFRRLTEDLRRVSLEALLSVQDRLRRYAGMPGAADETTRTAIREDAVILAIADLLDTHPRPLFRVLDACCGHGGLASHLSNNLGDRASKVVYLRIDQNAQHIGRARKPPSTRSKLNHTEYRVGEVWYLPFEWHGTMDLVVFSNTLHELPPHRFPELFENFNNIIARDVGRVCVIDMEELPLGEPEAIAINWKLEEVEAFLASGGFEVTPSNHPKSVGVFRIIVKHAPEIDRVSMLKQLHVQLRSKLISLVNERSELSDLALVDDDSLLAWVVLTGSVARCAEELLLVEQRIESIEATQSVRPHPELAVPTATANPTDTPE